MKLTCQDKLSPQQRDSETLAEAIKRIQYGKATEKLMQDQGRIELRKEGLHEPKV